MLPGQLPPIVFVLVTGLTFAALIVTFGVWLDKLICGKPDPELENFESLNK